MPQKQSDIYHDYKIKDENQIEDQFLKGDKDSDLGVYCDLFSAKTEFEGQDGGVVSALLAKGFEADLFDAAVVVRCLEGYSAQAVVVQNAQDAENAKGTKYLKVNVTMKLRELIREGKKRIAIVCTPCEAKNVRKIQQNFQSDTQITVIGLFCFEAFNKEKLKQKVGELLGIDIDEAEKTQVRQGKFIVTLDGKDYNCRVKDLEGAAEKACNYCGDFTSKFADISVGSVGSKAGCSTVIVRSEKGKKLVEELEATIEAVDKPEVTRLAKFKRERAERNLAEHKKMN
jgi:coenzyme F420-reducing hydrogenase beta subunit